MIYTSYKTRKQLANNWKWIPFGHAHYSYNSVYRKFKEVLDQEHVYYRELDRPEIYHSAEYILPAKQGSCTLLTIKPFEEIRVLKGAYNIAMVFWEFPLLYSPANENSGQLKGFNDPARMLSIPDEVWVGCEYTRTVFNNLGYENVHVVPAPVSGWAVNASIQQRRLHAKAVLAPLRLHSFFDRTTLFSLNRAMKFDKVFLTVANAGDFRKNWPGMIRAWELACAGRKDCSWIIKIVSDVNDHDFLAVTERDLANRFSEVGEEGMTLDLQNIFFVNQTLSDEAMGALYDCADFYFSGSICEGQNLPILEAMARGVVPISTNATAMADYISISNSIVVPTAEWALTKAVQLRYGLTECILLRANEDSLAAALINALKLSEVEIRELSGNAIKTVIENYSQQSIFSKIKKRMNLTRQL